MVLATDLRHFLSIQKGCEVVAVYVDNERNRFGRMIMCHMMADTLEELHEMAHRIGLKRRWFQMSNRGMPHYDISLSKRKEAVECGAIGVDRRRMVEIMKEWRDR